MKRRYFHVRYQGIYWFAPVKVPYLEPQLCYVPPCDYSDLLSFSIGYLAFASVNRWDILYVVGITTSASFKSFRMVLISEFSQDAVSLNVYCLERSNRKALTTWVRKSMWASAIYSVSLLLLYILRFGEKPQDGSTVPFDTLLNKLEPKFHLLFKFY